MTILINHSKGGCGKSLVAFNIAIQLSKLKNKKVEVVDLDVQKTLTVNNHLRKDLGLKPFSIFSFKDIKEFENYLRRDNDSKIIIIDTGGMDSKINRMIALVSDMIITPVSDSTVELQGLMNYESILKELSEISGEKITAKVLLNSIDPRKKDFKELKEFINNSTNFETLDTIIRRRKDFQESIPNGKSVVEYNKKGKAAVEIKSLIRELLDS